MCVCVRGGGGREPLPGDYPSPPLMDAPLLATPHPHVALCLKDPLPLPPQCLESGRVSYKRRSENTVQLEVPLEAATNQEEVENYKVWMGGGHHGYRQGPLS